MSLEIEDILIKRDEMHQLAVLIEISLTSKDTDNLFLYEVLFNQKDLALSSLINNVLIAKENAEVIKYKIPLSNDKVTIHNYINMN
jgi:hypothetical protein